MICSIILNSIIKTYTHTPKSETIFLLNELLQCVGCSQREKCWKWKLWWMYITTVCEWRQLYSWRSHILVFLSPRLGRSLLQHSAYSLLWLQPLCYFYMPSWWLNHQVWLSTGKNRAVLWSSLVDVCIIIESLKCWLWYCYPVWWLALNVRQEIDVLCCVVYQINMPLFLLNKSTTVFHHLYSLCILENKIYIYKKMMIT